MTVYPVHRKHGRGRIPSNDAVFPASIGSECQVVRCGFGRCIEFPSRMSWVRVPSPAPEKARNDAENGHLPRVAVVVVRANVYLMCTCRAARVVSPSQSARQDALSLSPPGRAKIHSPTENPDNPDTASTRGGGGGTVSLANRCNTATPLVTSPGRTTRRRMSSLSLRLFPIIVPDLRM